MSSRSHRRSGVIRNRLLILALALILLAVAAAPSQAAGPPPAVEKALRNASARWGVPYWELRAVAWCESRWNPRAVGSGSYGLLQFIPSTWAHTPYARHSVFDPWWNALAAAWLVRQDGGWREWTCKPW